MHYYHCSLCRLLLRCFGDHPGEPQWYTSHTFWCGPPVNGEYQHQLQQVALTG
jgi:hypothetical protein